MAVNPYEPPQTPPEPPDEACLVAWPATGAYVYYQTLVWQPDSPLPPVCVRSGLPAEETVVLTLKPLIDDDGSIKPAFELKLRLYDLRLPMHPSAAQRRGQPRLGFCLLLAGAALGMFALGAEGLTVGPSAGLMLVAGAAAIVLVGLGIRLMARPAPITLLCVDRGFVQLYGLHPSCLAALPEWPVPDRDSVRPRQA